MFNINANNVLIERLIFENTKKKLTGFNIGENINTTIEIW